MADTQQSPTSPPASHFCSSPSSERPPDLALHQDPTSPPQSARRADSGESSVATREASDGDFREVAEGRGTDAEDVAAKLEASDVDTSQEEEEETEDSARERVTTACVICLEPITDATYLPCSHQFCFLCIIQWAEISRKCPLCVADFTFALRTVEARQVRHDFPPVETPASTETPFASSVSRLGGTRPRGRGEAERRFSRWRHRAVDPWPTTREERAEDEAYERMIRLRRQVYRYHLRAKHIGANRRSGYASVVFPELVRSNVDFVARLIPWIRRELQAILQEEDVETVRAFVIAVARCHDLQSDRAITLLRDFLHDATETFVHELLSFARSPFTLRDYDNVVQYGIPLNELEQLALSDSGRTVLVASSSYVQRDVAVNTLNGITHGTNRSTEQAGSRRLRRDLSPQSSRSKLRRRDETSEQPSGK